MKRSWIGLSVAITLFGILALVHGTLSLTDIPNEAGTSLIKSTVNDNNTLTETAVNANIALITSTVTAQQDTNALVDTTDFTPRYIGDTLVGTVSNWVFTATGATTNDWTDLVN